MAMILVLYCPRSFLITPFAPNATPIEANEQRPYTGKYSFPLNGLKDRTNKNSRDVQATSFNFVKLFLEKSFSDIRTTLHPFFRSMLSLFLSFTLSFFSFQRSRSQECCSLFSPNSFYIGESFVSIHFHK